MEHISLVTQIQITNAEYIYYVQVHFQIYSVYARKREQQIFHIEGTRFEANTRWSDFIKHNSHITFYYTMSIFPQFHIICVYHNTTFQFRVHPFKTVLFN